MTKNLRALAMAQGHARIVYHPEASSAVCVAPGSKRCLRTCPPRLAEPR